MVLLRTIRPFESSCPPSLQSSLALSLAWCFRAGGLLRHNTPSTGHWHAKFGPVHGRIPPGYDSGCLRYVGLGMGGIITHVQQVLW